MNWHRVRLIFQREVRDQLRDRRTLFMVVVLPLLLYPGLAIGMVQVVVSVPRAAADGRGVGRGRPAAETVAVGSGG